ncbi:MAG: hypothetical protein ACJAUV_000840 [Flavobacteriales bacterium]
MLQKYVAGLGIKYVIFEKEGHFEGWISASVFLSQLFLWQRNSFDYEVLWSELAVNQQ